MPQAHPTLPSFKSGLGFMLWRVHYQYKYNDGDGTATGGGMFFVLANNRNMALQQAEPLIVKYREGCKKIGGHNETTEANVVSLENLIPAERERGSGGVLYGSDLWPVALSLEVDKKRYQLAVCLVDLVAEQ